ncbi:YeeE/YedE family protein [Pacificimonas sp. ICDLI1SI03]
MPYLSEALPLAELMGGFLIGGAAVTLMAFNGRILGASDILAGVLGRIPTRERTWRLVFILGLVSAPLIFSLFGGRLPAITMTGGPWTAAIAGLLVGYGALLGSGCTSGHAICGLGRLSPRSLAAVSMFMITGMFVASVIHPVIIEMGS